MYSVHVFKINIDNIYHVLMCIHSKKEEKKKLVYMVFESVVDCTFDTECISGVFPHCVRNV